MVTGGILAGVISGRDDDHVVGNFGSGGEAIWVSCGGDCCEDDGNENDGGGGGINEVSWTCRGTWAVVY